MSHKKPFLKWAGGKSKLVELISFYAGPASRLVEPFVGSGAVFVGTNYSSYLLSDTNEDLITLFNHVKCQFAELLSECEQLFSGSFNNEDDYYALRSEFNHGAVGTRRSALFLYLNRHGFNGLCRYNKAGQFNVPFGRYSNPLMPAEALANFHNKSQYAEFCSLDFRRSFGLVSESDVVYCDPPYLPLSETASFTSYAQNSFTIEDQWSLARIAAEVSRQKGVRVLISNHDTDLSREMYSGAHIVELAVHRSISSKASTRGEVGEILAIYGKAF